jgi:hypothetical protein
LVIANPRGSPRAMVAIFRNEGKPEGFERPSKTMAGPSPARPLPN